VTSLDQLQREATRPRYRVDELPEFLTMRLAEDIGVTDTEDVLRSGDPYYAGPEASEFERRFTPARIADDLNSRLRIVQRHARVRLTGGTRCHCCWSHEYSAPVYPCDTLLYLAQPFAEHPDWRKEWAL
jgi:Family of unknown function (DUF6221)